MAMFYFYTAQNFCLCFEDQLPYIIWWFYIFRYCRSYLKDGTFATLLLRYL